MWPSPCPAPPLLVHLGCARRNRAFRTIVRAKHEESSPGREMGRWEVPHALGAAGSPIPRCLLHSSSSTHLHIPHPRLAKGRAGTAGQRRESRAGTVGQHTRGIAGGASPNRLDRTGPDRAAPNSSTGRAVPAPAPQSRPKRGGAQPVRWVRRRSGQRGADRNGAVRNGGRCRRLPGARRAGPGKGTAVGAGERRGGRRRSAVPTRSRGLQPRGAGGSGARLGAGRARRRAGYGHGYRLPRILHGSGSSSGFPSPSWALAPRRLRAGRGGFPLLSLLRVPVAPRGDLFISRGSGGPGGSGGRKSRVVSRPDSSVLPVRGGRRW